MFSRATTVFAAAFLLLGPAVSRADLASYTQNFETLVMSDPGALSSDGWVVYGNVYSPAHMLLYGYGTFPAPNGGSAFSAIVTGEGGTPQGAQQLSIYNDYNNADHANGDLIEANVFREQTIGAADVGNTWTFQFDAKLGNLVSPTTAQAFIKTIDPAQSYAQTNFFPVDMTAIPATWGTYSVAITVDPALVGQIMQVGFNSTATNYVGSGIYYDNLSWTQTGSVGVGGPARQGIADLRPAAPNPFVQSTRLDFSLRQQGMADISVYDVGGRRVATLFHGVAEAGPHAAVWDGRLADGRLAPAGIYRAVLETAAERVSRALVLGR